VFQVVRGSVVSASQLFGADNVILGSVIYLAILIYSPVTTAFSYFGALCGTFAGINNFYAIFIHTKKKDMGGGEEEK